MSHTVSISIVVPVHNEEALITKFLSEVTSSCKKLKSTFELIVVENGSSDASWTLIKEIARSNKFIKPFKMPVAGYGQALHFGLLHARGQYIVVFNVDFWDDKFLQLTQKDSQDWDIVAASKLHPESHDNRGPARRFVTWGLSFVLRNVFGYRGTDTHGIKVLRKSSVMPIVKSSKTRTGIFDTELMLLADHKKLRILELPITIKEIRPARFGISRFFQTPRDLFRLAKAVPPRPVSGLILLTFISLFIFIRSLHFVSSLNFSTDQAHFSLAALKIFKERSLELIGPTFSLNYNGRYAFQGSAIYYFQLIFLLLGRWDPVVSSYLFMLFAALMLLPLYFGAKMLINKQAAILICVAYTLIPYFVNYTKFLWNPNFQLSLLPILVYFMGLYHKQHKLWQMLVIGLCNGFILQFHYQFLIILISLGIYYLSTSKTKVLVGILFSFGVLVGVSNLILFEFRHDFYNLKTLVLFFQNQKAVDENPLSSPSDYYLLSLLFFALLVLAGLSAKRSLPVFSFLLILIILDLYIYLPVPKSGFRMSPNWIYLSELKAHQIITSQNLSSYNVANLIYDPKAEVQHYLLQKNGQDINANDYTSNEYLFILSTAQELGQTQAYEVASHKPFQIISTWPIVNQYNLYLTKKLK